MGNYFFSLSLYGFTGKHTQGNKKKNIKQKNLALQLSTSNRKLPSRKVMEEGF